MAKDNRTNSGPQTPAGPGQACGKAEALIPALLIAYFGAKALFFALRIRERVFPDEVTWFGMAQVFSRSSLLPVDSPESYPLGLITHFPSLYFFLMGKALVCNVLPVDDLIFLRVVNVALGVLTVTFAWRLARILALSLVTSGLFLVMLTNTVMFTFTAGAVNYDNLATLSAVLALYYQQRFFQGRSAPHALLSFLFILAGMLTKNVMFPYGLALCLVALFHERRRLLGCWRTLPPWVAALGRREVCLLFLCLAGLVANLALYGGNMLRFGGLLPSMDMVLPVEACLQNRLFVRDYAVREFKAGRLSMLDAQRLALSIRDPGDRASSLNQLAEAVNEKKRGPQPRMGPWSYLKEWVEVIVSRTYSVAAHLSLFKYARDFYSYYAVFALAGALWAFRFRELKTPGMAGLAFVSICYTLVLMRMNYGNYLNTGLAGLALTGRYMFPVLVPVYLLTAQALFAKTPRWWQLMAGVTLGVLFVGGEFPWFLRQAGPEWYF